MGLREGGVAGGVPPRVGGECGGVRVRGVREERTDGFNAAGKGGQVESGQGGLRALGVVARGRGVGGEGKGGREEYAIRGGSRVGDEKEKKWQSGIEQGSF